MKNYLAVKLEHHNNSTNFIIYLLKLAFPWLLLLVCLGFLYKGQLFNLKPTFLNFLGTSDLRSHLAKIELIRSAIVNHGSWPSWTTSIYLGFPPFEHYPPLFYLLGGMIAVVASTVVSYKILILLNFILSIFCFSFFIKRATGLSRQWAVWAGIIFSLCPPLLLLHLYGAEPNIFSWNFAILTLALYCWPHHKYDHLWAFIWLVITILSHAYPVIFLGLVLFTWTIIQSYRTKPWYKPWFRLIKLWLPAIILTVWWWLPAVLTIDYLSQLADPFIWQRLISFIVLFILFGTLVFIYKSKDRLKDYLPIIIGLVWSCLLTWGARDRMPLVGHFLHNSRFAYLGIVSFCLPFIFSTLYYQRSQIVNFKKINIVLVTSILLILFTTFLTVDSFSYNELNSWLSARVIDFKNNETVIPLLPALNGKRVIVSPRLGLLNNADSLVTYGPFYNFATVTGAYSQGDPKFFNFTVHVEWEERWLFKNQTLNNIMGAAAADYLFIDKKNYSPGLVSRMSDQATNTPKNQLFYSHVEINQAALSVPALLDVSKNNTQLYTDIINLLLPDGYKLPLVEASKVDPVDYKLFPIVVGDSNNIIEKYPKAKAYLIINQSNNFNSLAKIENNPAVYLLPLDLIKIRNYFYQGKTYDYEGWVDFDIEAYKENYVDKLLAILTSVTDTWNKFKNDNVVSQKTIAEINNQSITVSAKPDSFVIVRESWFPRWQGQSGKLWRTTQGFMLGYLESNQLNIKYLNTWDFLKNWAATKLSMKN